MVCLPSAVQRLGNVISRRRKNEHINALNRDMLSWFYDQVFMPGQHLFICCVVLPRDIGIFLVRPMVHKSAYLHALCKLRYSADVVAMVVSDQHIVELRNPSSFRRRDDTVSIAAVKARPSGVNEQRLPRRTYDERRLSPLHINGINLQGLGR